MNVCVPYEIVNKLKRKGFGDGYFIGNSKVLYTEVINWFLIVLPSSPTGCTPPKG